MRISTGKLCLLATGLFFFSRAHAQVPSAITPAGDSTAPIYGSGLDQYNGFNGYLDASVPLHHIGGRGEAGLDLIWNLQPRWLAAYNGIPGYTPILFAQTYPDNNMAGAANNAFGLGGPGAVYIRTGFSWAACSGGGASPSASVTSVILVLPNGGQLSLVDTATNGAAVAVPTSGCNAYPTTWDAKRGASFRSTDGSQVQFNASSNVQEQHDTGHGYGVATVNGTLVFPNGVQYTVVNSQISFIEDRNGNQIKLIYGGPLKAIDWYLSANALTQVTDSLGRVTTINYSDSSCGGCLTINYPGAVGAGTHVVKVITGSLSSNLRSDFKGAGTTTVAALFTSSLYGSSTGYNPTVASSVVMPDGNQYSLSYNQYGEIAHVTLPSGAAVEYDYAPGSGSYGGYVAGSGSGAPVMIYRRLSERREYVNGGGGTSGYSSKTDHVATSVSGNTWDTVSTYAPGSSTALSTTIHKFQGLPTDALSQTGTGCNAFNEGAEVETDLGPANAGVTVANTYTNGTFGGSSPSCAYNETLTNRKTTLTDTNQQSQVVYQSDQYGNVLDEKDYDWGAGAPSATVLRHVVSVYQYQENSAYASTQYNMVHLPWYVSTFNTDGSQAAESIFQYDQYSANALSLAPGIGGHDGNYGTSQTIRGNVTTFYRNVVGSTVIGKSFSYDIAGNIITSAYDNGSTKFSYNDDGQNQYAFPTTITDAIGNATHVTYDYNAGKANNVKDPRGYSTGYQYADAFDRLTQVNEPTGGQANIYHESPTYVLTQQSQVVSGGSPVQTSVGYL